MEDSASWRAAWMIVAAMAFTGIAIGVSAGDAPVSAGLPIADPAPQGRRIDKAGVFANYFPAPGIGRHPGVLVLGGSEGGLGTGSMRDAKALQTHGFNVLQVAYFGVPGTPKELSQVPLETFDRALSWLRSQPGVDGDRIGLEGASKGAEAALLFASRTPRIRVVVVGMPSSVVWQGISAAAGVRSSWTAGGRGVSFLRYTPAADYRDIYGGFAKGLKSLGAHPDAIIAAEHIQGPIMLVCGKADSLWPSCPMAEQTAARLKAKRFPHRVELLEYDGAGHGVFGPPVDGADPKYSTLGMLGGSADDNNAARRASWARVRAFFDEAFRSAH